MDEIIYHNEFQQNSGAWLKARLGIVTASEVKNILTPTLKLASNDKARVYLYKKAAERITGRIEEDGYQSPKMERGHIEEEQAFELYSERYEKAKKCAFITRTTSDFTIGYSPDWLVGDDGLGECKSRDAHHQIKTMVLNVRPENNRCVPDDYVIQCQTGLFVTQRNWIDFVSYSNGLPMAVIRTTPIPEYQEAIKEAVTEFEILIQRTVAEYDEVAAMTEFCTPTEYIETVEV